MTKNSDFKKRVRALAARDGIPYSEARRRINEVTQTLGMIDPAAAAKPEVVDDLLRTRGSVLPEGYRPGVDTIEVVGLDRIQGTDDRFGAVRGGTDPMARLETRNMPLQERFHETTHLFIQPTRTDSVDTSELTPSDVFLGRGHGRTVDFDTLIRLELRRKPAVLILDHTDGAPRLAVPDPADPRGFKVLPTDHADWVCSTCGGYGTGEPDTHDPDHVVSVIGRKRVIEVEEAYVARPISGEALKHLHELLGRGRIQPERDDQHHPDDLDE